MIFYYVRHGDPIYDPDSLTELGHKQAAALSKRMALYGLDEVYSSTSIRAQMTAEPTCKALGIQPVLLDWANEGHAFEEFSVRKPDGNRAWAFHLQEYRDKFNSRQVCALGMDWYKHPDFEKENFAKGEERIYRETDAFMKSLGFEHDRVNACYKPLFKTDGQKERRIALFAHEGFGKAFLSSLLDIPYPLVATRYELSHSSVTVIHFSEEGEVTYPQILQWANDSHLYKGDILTPYNHWKNI